MTESRQGAEGDKGAAGGRHAVQCRLVSGGIAGLACAAYPGDRPQVIPAGTANLAFVGQCCEVPDNVAYTVEYSVHSARLAVNALLGLEPPVPPAYQGLDHPNALVEALRRILQ